MQVGASLPRNEGHAGNAGLDCLLVTYMCCDGDDMRGQTIPGFLSKQNKQPGATAGGVPVMFHSGLIITPGRGHDLVLPSDTEAWAGWVIHQAHIPCAVDLNLGLSAPRPGCSLTEKKRDVFCSRR